MLNNWWQLLWIGLGGFLGAISRYFFFMLDNKLYHHTKFPMGTLVVNLIGSLLIGIALGLSVKFNLLQRGTNNHFLLITGFLGAFTTFSTFTQDSFQLLLKKEYLFFIENIFLHFFFGILLVAFGYWVINKNW